MMTRLKTPSNVPEVRAVSRAFAVLRAFGPERKFWPLAELARRSGLDKGTTRRLLHTLKLNGLVEHDEQSYALTLGLFALTANIYKTTDLQTLARPILQDLAEKVGGAAFFWLYEGGEAVCIDRVRARDSIITTIISGGNRASLNCGAAPRVLLAYIADNERDIALQQPQPARTARSVTAPAALRSLAHEIRQRGYEVVSDDFIIGLTAVGVPVETPSGQLVGAISITNLTDRIAMQNGVPVLLDDLKAAARLIGAGATI